VVRMCTIYAESARLGLVYGSSQLQSHHLLPNSFLPTSATFNTSLYVKLVLVCRSYRPSSNACGSPSRPQFAIVSGRRSSSLVRASIPWR